MPPSIRDQVEAFETGIRARNRREWVAALIVSGVLVAGAVALPMTPAMLASVGGTVVACAFVSLVLWRWGRLPTGLRSLTGEAELVAFRNALRDQARLLRWAPAWYMAPLAVGMLAFFTTASPGARPWGEYGVVAVLSAVVCVANRLAARHLACQAEALARSITTRRE